MIRMRQVVRAVPVPEHVETDAIRLGDGDAAGE